MLPKICRFGVFLSDRTPADESPATGGDEKATGGTETPEPPPPPGPELTRVSTSGDAQFVELRGGGKTYTLPAAVPAGTYTVRASFSGEASEEAGTVMVEDGRPMNLNCEAFFRSCTGSAAP